MAQLNITLDSDTVKGLFLGHAPDALVPLLETILNQVLEALATETIGAQKYERTEERKAYRNGSRERSLKTRIGAITLDVPRLRSGEFSHELFERYQRAEQALVLTMMEMVLQGVSTRKVTKITEELCGTSFSKSTVSQLCKGLDETVQAFRNRPLEKRYPFVMVDAMYVKVRELGRVRSKALLIAMGVNEEGYREVLGFTLWDSETHLGWKTFFEDLKKRGIGQVDYVISDAHTGLVKALQEVFVEAAWQRCQVHFMRNIMEVCPSKVKPQLLEDLRDLWSSKDPELARERFQEILVTYEALAPKSMEVLEAGFDDAIAVLHLPTKYRRRLRSTNSLERLNQEIRRRERVIRIFPSGESAIRLMGALLAQQSETWLSGRKWLDMAEYWKELIPKDESAEVKQAA
ncbi:MAG: IS256 family transposase [Peptoniphilaceae bacterium]|jgi:putative transposase